MSDIIPIFTSNFNNYKINSVNARDLHIFPESRQDFSTWIKNRLEDFQENIDFIRLHNFVEREIGSTKRIDYHITLDTAKHISFLERNENGKKIRQYFIDFEKNNKAPQLTQREQVLLLAQSLLDAEKENQILRINNIEKEQVIQSQESIIDEFITISNTKNYTEVGKILHQSPLKFIQWLRDNKYIMKHREPYQKYLDMDLFVIKTPKTEQKHCQPSYHITPKGFEYFRKKILQHTTILQ